MREINKISEALFEKVRDRFEDVSLGDENAKATQNPEEARFFNFDYIIDGKNYGNITLSVIDEISLKVYFSKNISEKLDDVERREWYNFLRELREFARRNLLSFEPRDITRKTLKHRDIQQVSKADSTYNKDEVIGESRMYGTSRSSYENDGNVRLIVRHTDRVDPKQRGARTRKIKSIYVETAEGERLKLPHNNLRYARAMARHISEGGAISDEFGQYITNIAEECGKLRPFKNSMRRRTFEDSETQEMVEAAFEYHGLLNDTLKRMSGRKGYAACKENFHADESVLMDDVNLDEMRERFVKRVYKDNMDEALPIVQKAYKMKKENKFAKQFESWANAIAENWEPSYDDVLELLADELTVGVDAINAINALEGTSISKNEMFDNLVDELVALSEQNPSEDARDTILGWMQTEMPYEYQSLINDVDDEDVEEAGTYGASTMDEPVVNEGRVKELDADLKELSDAEFKAKYKQTKEEMKAKLSDSTQLNEYLLKPSMPASEILNLNLFADFTEDELPSAYYGELADSPEWMALEQQYSQIAQALKQKLAAQPHNRILSAAEARALEGTWYDGSDAYSSVEDALEFLPEIYDAQIDMIEAFLAGNITDEEFGDDDDDFDQLDDYDSNADYDDDDFDGDQLADYDKNIHEAQGDDYVNKSEKLKRMGAKPLSTLDKLKNIPRGFKAMAKGDTEDDLAMYNKSKASLEEMKRLAGLK